MHKGRPLVLLLASLICFGSLAAEDVSLWEYANPAADVILYVNTKQPEKAMDKRLWKRISRDKERAIAEDPDGQFFDTKGRDLELVANLYIVSMSPFCGSIDGVANITGNLQGDIDKLLGSLKEGGGIQPQITKQDNRQFYNLSLPQMEQLPPADIMLVPIGSNQVQFRINISPKGKMVQQTLNASKQGSPLTAGLRNRELAFACSAYADKFSTIPLAATNNARELNAFLQKLKSLCVSGYVDGLYLIVDASFLFKTVTDAAEFSEKAKNFLTQLLPVMGAKDMPKTVLTGSQLAISLKIDIAASWNLVSRVTSNKNEPSMKKSKGGNE